MTKTYSFMTENNNRVDIKASNPVVAWNKINKEKHFDYETIEYGPKTKLKKIKAVFNGLFITYDKDGMAGIESWISIKPFLIK